MPGSLTKLGQIATAYQSSDKWTVKELCHRLGVDCSEIDLVERPLQSQDDYKKWKQEQAALGNKPKKTKRKFVPQKSSTGFYEHCLKRCFEDTQEGNRYMSMVGLSVVAVKKGVEKERLESDLRELLKHYNEIGSVITVKEMQKAMRAYNVKALKCPPATLEAWFGWNFRRNRTESKGRTREEHLKRARLLQTADYPNGEWRNKEGAPTKEQQVKAWRQAHPDGKPKECMQDTGISKNTVYKWWNSL